MAKTLPAKHVDIFGRRISLNPGPSNQKEHMLVTVMANVAYGGMGNAGAVALILRALKLDILYGVKDLTNSAGFIHPGPVNQSNWVWMCWDPETVSRLSTSHAVAGKFGAKFP
jgi:hypothetical protein